MTIEFTDYTFNADTVPSIEPPAEIKALIEEEANMTPDSSPATPESAEPSK